MTLTATLLAFPPLPDFGELSRAVIREKGGIPAAVNLKDPFKDDNDVYS